jgi:hypothetical protein
MSTAEATTPEPPPLPDDDASMSWLEKLVRQWGLMQVAHDGMMLDKIGKQNDRVLKLADAARDGTIGKPGAAAPLGDDMGVNVGNEHKEYHYHYGVAQQANTTGSTAAAVVREIPKVAEQAAKLGGWSKAAIAAAALLGTGGLGVGAIGAGLGAWALMNQSSKTEGDTTIVQPFDPTKWKLEVSETPPTE